ncbi:hypothetical protein U1Q18_026301 [Sarracenia purpurea var. burkii]
MHCKVFGHYEENCNIREPSNGQFHEDPVSQTGFDPTHLNSKAWMEVNNQKRGKQVMHMGEQKVVGHPNPRITSSRGTKPSIIVSNLKAIAKLHINDKTCMAKGQGEQGDIKARGVQLKSQQGGVKSGYVAVGESDGDYNLNLDKYGTLLQSHPLVQPFLSFRGGEGQGEDNNKKSRKWWG